MDGMGQTKERRSRKLIFFEKMRALKYTSVFSIPISVALSFVYDGPFVFLPLGYAFVFLPLLELVMGTDQRNLSAAEKEMARNDRAYDWLLYLTVPMQFAFLIWFFNIIGQSALWTAEWVGRVSAMGIMCGVFGINVAHELGHRANKFEQFLAKSLLLTSLYMHFFIEHNYGHHRNVSTPEDPSSARKGEWLYLFILRSMALSLVSAWKIEAKRLERKKERPFSLKNEILRMWLLELMAVALVGFVFGGEVLLAFVLAGLAGGVLLETINYIEHYGLCRKKVSEFRYEDVNPSHSWNSNHVIGRLMLFELSRHSDHHFDAGKKYQLLDNFETSPQMPTGYPGMMVLAAIPPLWFWMMNSGLPDSDNPKP